jgi:folate-binding protein YgfZ
MKTDLTLPGYRASLEGAAYYPVPEPGCLRISGRDRAAFLQRQTTNDVRLLAPGRAMRSVLTDPTARILDVFTLFEETEPGEDYSAAKDGAAKDGAAIYALTLPGRGPQTAGFLRSRIFFNDQVALEDLSQAFTQVELEGPQAQAALAGLGLEGAPEPGEVQAVFFSGSVLKVTGRGGFSGTGYRLLAPAALEEALFSRLEELGVERLSPEGYQTRRIEAGLPAAEAELTSAYTPLETGLEEAVSNTKGCYTGQEVIARQITYDKITQRMVGLKLPSGIAAGARLWAEGRPAGEITSSINSPRSGWIALAVIKRPYFEPGTEVSLDQAGAEPAGVVSSLPFIP